MTTTGQADGGTGGGGAGGGTAVFGESQVGERLVYEKPKWQDLWAMILFYLHVCVIFGLAIFVMTVIADATDDDDSTRRRRLGGGSQTFEWTGIFVTLLICMVVGIAFGLLWLQIMKMFAEYIIKGMLFFNMLCWVIVIVFGLAMGEGWLPFVIFCAICLLFVCLYTWCVWSRIPFASVLLSIASSIAATYEGTIVVSLITCIIDFIWFVVWIMAFVGIIIIAIENNEDVDGLVVFLMLISFYWGMNVFRNVSHTTTCGVAATWYFSKDPHKPSMCAFQRTMTTSFGSVCFGSLLVAILQAARGMFRSCRYGCCVCIAMCFLACIEWLLRYFNMYAFAQVAIYGTSFIESAKATWNLFLAKGILAVINDDLTGLALSCGAFFGFLVCGIVGYFVALAFYIDTPFSGIAYSIAIFGALLGYALVVLILLVVRSGVVCLFVCFAEDPAALQANRPDAFDRLVHAHSGMQQIGSGGVIEAETKV